MLCLHHLVCHFWLVVQSISERDWLWTIGKVWSSSWLPSSASPLSIVKCVHHHHHHHHQSYYMTCLKWKCYASLIVSSIDSTSICTKVTRHKRFLFLLRRYDPMAPNVITSIVSNDNNRITITIETKLIEKKYKIHLTSFNLIFGNEKPTKF